MQEDKLYRVQTKAGAHINEKVKEDGSRAAIQFDEDNGLQGPVDLVEVDRDELLKEKPAGDKYGPFGRAVGQVLLEDAVAPAVENVLEILLMRGAEAGLNWMEHKVIPAAKAKGNELLVKAKEKRAEKKALKAQQKTPALPGETVLAPAVYRTPEEVNQIINNMNFAALYIAAGIRELSHTVISDDSSEPQQMLDAQNRRKEVSVDHIMSTIEFMLDEQNSDMLDQAAVQIFGNCQPKDFAFVGAAAPTRE